MVGAAGQRVSSVLRCAAQGGEAFGKLRLVLFKCRALDPDRDLRHGHQVDVSADVPDQIAPCGNRVRAMARKVTLNMGSRRETDFFRTAADI